MADDGAEALHSALHEAIGALDGARTRLAAAGQHAESAAHRMTRNGFHGIARALTGVKTNIDTAHTQVGFLAAMVSTQAGAASTVTSRSTPDDVLTTLTPVITGIDQATATCEAARETMATLEATIRRVLSGGTPQSLLSKTGPASAALTATRTHLGTAHTAAGTAVTEAREAGATPSRTGTSLLPAGLMPPTGTVTRVGPPVPDPEDLTDDAPQGEEPDESERETPSIISRTMSMLDQHIGDVSEQAGKIASNVERALQLKAPELRPPTYVQTSTQVRVEPYTPPTTTHNAALGDIVTNSALAVYALVKGGQKVTHLVKKWRKKTHEH